jgi:alpha-beta hydrolase superfamily lysophospholipase
MTVEFFLEANDEQLLFVKNWDLEKHTIKGIIQIAHGLGETADYYAEFAEKANAEGFAVYVAEARGHGRTAGDVKLPDYKGGDIGEGGFGQLRDDLYAATKFIRAKYPEAPLFLLGHSMGSVVARLYSFAHSGEIRGLILTGASSASKNIDDLVTLVEKEIQKNGLKAPCKETFEALFYGLNQQFEPATTALDWITSDKEMVEYSLKLPYTYILFNNQFYLHYLSAVKEVEAVGNISKIPPNLPIFLLSGDRDSATDNGKRTIAQFEKYKAVGLEDIQLKLYENKRHSLLREVNRGEVTADILDWITTRI